MDGYGADQPERWTANRTAASLPSGGRALPSSLTDLPSGHPRTDESWSPVFGSARDEAPFEVERYDPNRFLQGLVSTAWRQAEDRGQAVYVQGSWPTIAVYPTSFTAVVSGGEDTLRPYAGQEDLPTQASLVFGRDPYYSISHPDMAPLDVLLWKLALGASRGRLPLGTPLNTPCALRDWPNFTRLIVTPGAMSIAALWTRQTCTLSQTIRLLGLPPADVFAFYSAAAAIDVVCPELPSPPVSDSRLSASPALPGPDSSLPPAIAPVQNRSLLRRVFDKLRTT